jgi:hypothetical protein
MHGKRLNLLTNNKTALMILMYLMIYIYLRNPSPGGSMVLSVEWQFRDITGTANHKIRFEKMPDAFYTCETCFRRYDGTFKNAFH